MIQNAYTYLKFIQLEKMVENEQNKYRLVRSGSSRGCPTCGVLTRTTWIFLLQKILEENEARTHENIEFVGREHWKISRSKAWRDGLSSTMRRTGRRLLYML